MKRLRGQEALGERQVASAAARRKIGGDRSLRLPAGSALAALTLISGSRAGAGAPFALRAGAEFFCGPRRLVIAIALVLFSNGSSAAGSPRRFRLALRLLFIAVANRLSPRSCFRQANGCGCSRRGSPGSGKRSEPLLDGYASWSEFIDDIVSELEARKTATGPRAR
jgi:hypothetical protein